MRFFKQTPKTTPWPPPGPITSWPPSDTSLAGSSLPAVMFDPARTMVNVVGEGSYQGSIENIAGGRTIDGGKVRDHTAFLIPEPSNPYDMNAVRVILVSPSGIMAVAGYLAREDAIAYRPTIDRLAAEGTLAACRASLSGGWDRGPDDRGSFGVRLSIGTPEEVARELDNR